MDKNGTKPASKGRTKKAKDSQPKNRKLKARYNKGMIEVAAKAAKAGATDQKISDLIGCHLTSYYRWRNNHEEFDFAINEARKPPDQEEELQKLEQYKEWTEAWFADWLKNKGRVVEAVVYDNGLSGNFKKIRQGGPPDLKLIRQFIDAGASQEEFKIIVEVAQPPTDTDEFDDDEFDGEIGIEDHYEEWLAEAETGG